MKWLVSLLFYSLMADLCWGGQCRMANWWDSFQTSGWSRCYTDKEYMRGMWRNYNEGRHDKIYLLEEAECCRAPAPNGNSESTCTTSYWWGVLDSFKQWALCPTGYFLNGLYRSSGNWVYNIEEAKCCRPVGLPNEYDRCVDKSIVSSFDHRGLSSCDDGYYMVGFYKGTCNQLGCIEKLKCCKMSKGLRLVGGNWEGEGRVEIFHSHSWGTVCDDEWDINDARVVCRELGYSKAICAPKQAAYGYGSGKIWLDDVECQGHEDSIANCRHRGWDEDNCSHFEDASVVCS